MARTNSALRFAFPEHQRHLTCHGSFRPPPFLHNSFAKWILEQSSLTKPPFATAPPKTFPVRWNETGKKIWCPPVWWRRIYPRPVSMQLRASDLVESAPSIGPRPRFPEVSCVQLLAGGRDRNVAPGPRACQSNTSALRSGLPCLSFSERIGAAAPSCHSIFRSESFQARVRSEGGS